MGHYRSEMGYEEEDRKEAERLKVRKQRIINNIRKAIQSDGIESVLAEIIDDPTMASIKYRS